MNDIFAIFLWLIITIFLLYLFGDRERSQQSSANLELKEIDVLKKQCQRLKQELQQQSQLSKIEINRAIFERLQTLLTNYPTACMVAQTKPDLPAKNLVALFTPLENLLSSWGYQAIGQPWEQISYDPQLHQPDNDDIIEGELVYIRFVGYRDRDKILVPAKVSRQLPNV
jgi:molecular chaperone GrpE (heat shock protein)